MTVEPGENPRSRARINNEFNPYITPGQNRTGPHWWEASALITASTLLTMIIKGDTCSPQIFHLINVFFKLGMMMYNFVSFRYRALFSYEPVNEDELRLEEGDEVIVLEKCDDGWFVGTSSRTHSFGTFPGNYVERVGY